MTPDFSCERCQDSLPWYVANSLSNDKRAAMERHLASCERCRDALAAWREVAAALHRADERIPLDTASVTTWTHISHQLREQKDLAYKTNERLTMRQQNSSLPPASTPGGESPLARLHRRVPAFVSLVAAAAVIALSIGVFSLFAGRGGHLGKVTSTPSSTCAPSQATANLPAHTTLTAIAPVGTDDGWAVGGASDPKQPTSPSSTLMLRLQNCHWTPVRTPILNGMLYDISMATPDEGWAVGGVGTLDTSTNTWNDGSPIVLHYTHGSWQQVKVMSDTEAIAEKVKMVSADEGWMLLEYPNTGAFRYSLLHYQNGTWTNVPLDFRKPQMAVADLDARQPGEVWLVGFDNSNGGFQPFAAHYSRSVWTPYTGAALTGDPREFASQTDFFSIGVSELSPADVWVAGPGGLYHFDGTSWAKASIQGTAGVTGDSASYSHLFGQIAMLSPAQGWAFPAAGDTLLINHLATQEEALHYDHGAWHWIKLEIQGATAVMPITDFVNSSPTQGWAIAQQIYNVPEQSSVLLYYDGNNWGVVRQQP